MSYFPFMIEVKGHKALVVGAGKSAGDKIRYLTEFGALVTVVAPVISADVVKQGKNITLERRVYRPGETKGYEIVVAATDNSAVNKQVAHDAARFGAICTVADDPYRGGFVFPSIIKTDRYSVAISTDGEDDRLEKRIKEVIKAALPEKNDEIDALILNGVKSSDQAENSEEERSASDNSGVAHMRLADIAGAGAEENEALSEEKPEPSEEPETEAESDVIRVGAQDDRLDNILADSVISMLSARGYKCEKTVVRPGDLEKELSYGNIDLAVCQASSMPVILPDNVVPAACLMREDARDILVTRNGMSKDDIEVIGTSSEIRKFQIERYLHSGKVVDLDGSIQERIQKLKDGEIDAIMLNSCEVKKLMLIMDDDLSFEFIDAEKQLPQAGQGITVVESRSEGKAYDAAAEISDIYAMRSLEAEREFLKYIGAVKNDEAAAYSIFNDGRILMKVMKYMGGRCAYFAGAADEEDGLELAHSLGEKIIKNHKIMFE